MKYFRITLLAVFAAFLITSCGGNKKQETQTDDTFDLDSYIKAAEAVDPTLSKVDQIFKILDMVNAEYYDVLTNDPYSAHNYKYNYPVAAANLGVYVTDIIYHYYGDATESMYLSFSAAQELASHLGLESEFASWTIEKLEGTAVQRDTIAKLFNTLLADSEKYTNEQERVFVHTAFLAGSFIEKVYISGSILKQKLSGTNLSKEQDSDIRELLIIYLNQLNPATGVLHDAFNRQQDQLQTLVTITTFERLEVLSEKLKEVKPELIASSISDIASNADLNATFDLVANLRNVVVNASE
ncbi:MAG: hypothetical protein ABFS28_03605 [Bacteroidota bacterium]